MDFLKVARDGANLVSLFSSFHNCAPRYENAFWPVRVLKRYLQVCFSRAKVANTAL